MNSVRVWTAILLLASFAVPLAGQENWPQFRGPDANGYATTQKLPVEWSESKNVAWKTPIHDRGWSSPVIWGNQIWLTTATRDGKKLYAVCVNKDSGKIVYDFLVFTVDKPQQIANENSYATPTSLVDETRVYFHYGTYGTACYDKSSGKKIWERRDLKCDHESGAGPASSPMLVGDLFVVNVDGRDVQYVIALNKRTGKTEWKTPRSIDYTDIPVNQRKAYSMPILMPRGEAYRKVRTSTVSRARTAISTEITSGGTASG